MDGDSYPLQEELQRRLQIPVNVVKVKDSNAAMFAELKSGSLQEAGNAIAIIYQSTGTCGGSEQKTPSQRKGAGTGNCAVPFPERRKPDRGILLPERKNGLIKAKRRGCDETDICTARRARLQE